MHVCACVCDLKTTEAHFEAAVWERLHRCRYSHWCPLPVMHVFPVRMLSPVSPAQSWYRLSSGPHPPPRPPRPLPLMNCRSKMSRLRCKGERFSLSFTSSYGNETRNYQHCNQLCWHQSCPRRRKDWCPWPQIWFGSQLGSNAPYHNWTPPKVASCEQALGAFCKPSFTWRLVQVSSSVRALGSQAWWVCGNILW